MTRKIMVLSVVLLGVLACPQPGSAQSADCAQWAQRLQARADAFDARCSRTPMTINGPQWQACQAEQSAILAERDRWVAACRR
jgi:hypothetical protein